MVYEIREANISDTRTPRGVLNTEIRAEDKCNINERNRVRSPCICPRLASENQRCANPNSHLSPLPPNDPIHFIRSTPGGHAYCPLKVRSLHCSQRKDGRNFSRVQPPPRMGGLVATAWCEGVPHHSRARAWCTTGVRLPAPLPTPHH